MFANQIKCNHNDDDGRRNQNINNEITKGEVSGLDMGGWVKTAQKQGKMENINTRVCFDQK